MDKMNKYEEILETKKSFIPKTTQSQWSVLQQLSVISDSTGIVIHLHLFGFFQTYTESHKFRVLFFKEIKTLQFVILS